MENETRITMGELLDRESLTREEQNDLVFAAEARDNAYAPYSNFKVGAAIRSNNGNLTLGNNVENVSYHVLHAEAAAIGRMDKATRESGLKRVTVVGGPEGKEDHKDPVTPCGSCRQTLLEFVKPGENPIVIMAGIRGKVLKIGLRELLPFAFFPASLEEKRLGNGSAGGTPSVEEPVGPR